VVIGEWTSSPLIALITIDDLLDDLPPPPELLKPSSH
jgi:hypothetical protein